MAVSKYIQQVQKAAGGAPRSTAWYRDKIKELGTPSSLDLIRDGKKASRPFFGRLNMFIYDPKLKAKLPYYDSFPLVLPIEQYKDGFLGLNLHYLPIGLRVRLLDRLVDFSNNDKFDETTRLVADYAKLKNVRLIRPCVKRYLSSKVKSQFRRIDADEFTIATLLPVARFKKASANEVYRDSRRMI
tara:strand:- start:1871 stop:2428 length:558 start_codon:yes stop_codon:yes gene_type:complete